MLVIDKKKHNLEWKWPFSRPLILLCCGPNENRGHWSSSWRLTAMIIGFGGNLVTRWSVCPALWLVITRLRFRQNSGRVIFYLVKIPNWGHIVPITHGHRLSENKANWNWPLNFEWWYSFFLLYSLEISNVYFVIQGLWTMYTLISQLLGWVKMGQTKEVIDLWMEDLQALYNMAACPVITCYTV